MIVEQQRPGEEQSRTEAEASGLPDAWIYTDDGWALLFECKIAAGLSINQLRRHLATAERRGFTDPALLVITARPNAKSLPAGTKQLRWTDVYTWLTRQAADSVLARTCVQYFAILEAQLLDGYLQEGGLTTFSGVTFGPGHPYSYLEAKRLLKLALEELRKDKRLVRHLGMNPKGAGRPAITGRDGDAVWNFLRLRYARGDEAFTRFPHLTLTIEADRLVAMVTIPNSIQPKFRRNLVELGPQGFGMLLERVCAGISAALHKDHGAAPWAIVVQRRYQTQRSKAIVDARLEFDLRTGFQNSGKHGKKVVKLQPQWLSATYGSLAKKRSNLQLAIGAAFKYGRSTSVNEPAVLKSIAETWLACRPLLTAMGVQK